jgi:hypothetical protein
LANTRELAADRILVCLGRQIFDMNGPSLTDDASAQSSVRQRQDEIWSNRSFVSDKTEDITVDAVDRGIEGLTQPGRARCHCREHRLDVRGRARDDPENFAGRGLLLL